MNTRMSYAYRDGAGYGCRGEVTVAGRLCFADLEPFLIGAEFFIPGDVGLPELQPRLGEQGLPFPTRDDHPLHTVETVEPTDDPAEGETSAAELLRRFREADSAGWDEVGAMERLGLI